MEEVGAQLAPPIFMHQALANRFCEPPSLPRKRDLSYQTPGFQYPNPSQQHVANPRDWNPKQWEWDAVRFIAKPMDTEILQPGTATAEQRKKERVNGNGNSITSKKTTAVNEDDDSLQLNLGGRLNSVEEPVSRPNKKVRSGSPGSTNYPMCQVDNCKEDLSNAKDYHRRHKVCEVHSKATKALVGKHMQRFCQQCSRFHLLSEFDEGKRSCRRRLAGHNRRRRKTQPEDVTSRLLLPVNRDNAGNGNLDIVNLLTALARSQGKNEDKNINCSSLPNRDQLVQILNKINSLPLPMDLAAKLPNVGVLNRKNQEQPLLGHQNQLNGKNTSSPSTMDLLAALSATLTSSSKDAFAILSQRSTQSSDSEKTKSTCPDHVAAPTMQNRVPLEFASGGGERSSTSYQSPVEDSECQIQETRANLPLQLFSSSPENDSPPKLASSRKYFSSDSSNPMEERSPTSSPAVQKLFPMHSTVEAVKYEKMPVGRESNAIAEGSRTHGSILPLELFSGSKRGNAHGSFQQFPSQAGYTSSSGSDHSPSSLNSDAQDRTGRIIFKLFDKDPSHFPGTLRTQIYNWLSNSPSEMESYIRPGCVVLSLYVSMSYVAWEQLEGNLLQYVNSLLHYTDSDFWRKARFLVHTGRQLASHKDGKIRLCKSWRTLSSPELISVSPLAIVGGQETSLLLRGRNLTNPGTKIHCAYMGGYSSMQISGSAYQGTTYDEVSLGGFKVQVSAPSAVGRFFIEVEDGFKGNSFPIIIADATICKELRLLESEFDIEAKASDIISEEHAYDGRRPTSREEVLHFLNELGWLFQRRSTCPLFKSSDYLLCRFKFLLIFSVERDYCALVKVLLDILVESNLYMDGLSRESVEMLSEIQLLSRAVKRRCRKMADLLIHYSISSIDESSKKYIFLPNLEGAGGITPLHLAACTSGSDDMVDVLTDDPQEIGLSCWKSLLDVNGQSPYAYAIMRNNHSYNKLVARKFADRRNGQVSVTIGQDEQSGLTAVQLHEMSSRSKQDRSSCAKCAVVATKFNKRFPGSQGLLQRPYVHSMLAIAAVCVCVCLFLRGSPDIGSVAPFKWENLDFGTI
ncbi:squamosa promoter-binding-like protein 14 [Herrania umbratica]|uniref:Squamosa promoter-binding-like protein 14 n=1 Tax=Herrania umbratica TaxID=108875 RepID=A0A6J1A8Z8_9ROSI|nr:squamosa promoter-binding-like protein 14 [Herrania umbratica]